MTRTVREFDGDAGAWDAFVRSSPGWTHFHLYGWRQVVESVFGHECLYLACHAEGGELDGVLPLVRVKSRLFGHFLVSMPFLNYGGPLGSTDAVRTLTARAVDLAGRDGVGLLELRSRAELPLDLPVSHRKVTVLVDLPGANEGAVWSNFNTNHRNKVRKAGKHGVEVRFGAQELAPFFRVFARHMRDLGTPTQSERFFRAIERVFRESVLFGCAYLDGVPIAGGCGFHWDREFEITWSSALRIHNTLRPNYLLQWEFMRQAMARGCETYNFGRSTPGGGTHDFKLQWGGRDEPLWWYQAGAGASQTPSPDQGAYRWGPAIWKRLPVGLATRLGPLVVRSIP